MTRGAAIEMSRFPGPPTRPQGGGSGRTRILTPWYAACMLVATGCFYIGPPWTATQNLPPVLVHKMPSTETIIVTGAVNTATVRVNDPEGDAVVGHIDDAPLEEILNNDRMRAFRRAHFRRSFPGICRECGEYESPVAGPRFER